MKFGSLFAGIGGFDLGLERAGMKCAWQVEIDPYASRVLEKHWPNVKRYTDVREVGAHNLEPVDLICGGFPCQPHSVAGKRKASADPRDLWGEFARIIRELKPRWVVAENVPGLLSSESGRFFGRVLRDLAESGFDIEWQCLPASTFGAPHRRDRVWIVADSDIKRRGKKQIGQRRSSSPTKFGDDGIQEPLADSDGMRKLPEQGRDDWVGNRSKELADAQGVGWREGGEIFNAGCLSAYLRGESNFIGKGERIGGEWAFEPDVGRVAHGVPARVHRLRCLGNSIVPQIAEWIGSQIKELYET